MDTHFHCMLVLFLLAYYRATGVRQGHEDLGVTMGSRVREEKEDFQAWKEGSGRKESQAGTDTRGRQDCRDLQGRPEYLESHLDSM